jgi:hypothetical protein
LVTVDRSWPVAAVPEALLQTVKPLPVNAGEWVALLDGLQAAGGDASVNAIQEFASCVKGHLMAVTPQMKKVRYEREMSATPESWEQFVELDSSQFLAIDSTASSATIQKKLREVLPLVVTNFDAIRFSVDGVGRDLSSFQQAVGQDLDLQENVLSRVRGELGTRPLDLGVLTVWGHVQSLMEESNRLVESTSVAKLATQIDTSVGDALDKVVMGKILPTVKPSFLFAKRYTTGVNGTPGDVLESWLHALEMGTGVRNLGIPIGVPHPVMPIPVREPAPGMQAQMDAILARLNDQEAQIWRLQEANVAQTNTIAMMRSAMASEVCEMGGEAFDPELAAGLRSGKPSWRDAYVRH